MSRLPRIVSHLTFAMIVCGFAGCTTFHFPFEKRMPRATASDPAVQMLCLWQQAEGRDPEGYPCKGFSGQILFLSNKAATPVQIDGAVRIYLFDDQGTEEDQTKPIRQFDFDAGSWAIHLTETSLGPTYSVFVPYVRRGVKEANCALRVRLKPKQGPTIFSELSSMPLNGNKKPVMGTDAKPLSVEEVDRDAADAMSQKLHRTTTISMGSNPKITESVAKKDVNAAKKDVTAAQKDVNAGQVTQASHEVVSEAPKESPEAERIRKLEAMVQQLQEQKATVVADPVPSNPPRRTRHPLGMDSRSPGDSGAEAQPVKRIKLAPKRLEIDDEENSPEPVESSRQKHPLDE